MNKKVAIKLFNFWVGRCWDNEKLGELMRESQQDDLMKFIDKTLDNLPD